MSNDRLPTDGAASNKTNDAVSQETWVWDGRPEALLALTQRAWEQGRAPHAVLRKDGYQGDLFAQAAASSKDMLDTPDMANMAPKVKLSLPGSLYSCALRIWMSERPLEMVLLRVAARVKARGDTVLRDWSDAEVRMLGKTVREVLKEEHMLMGFARFCPSDSGIWVAELEPVFNILPALLHHFEARFNGEAFMLADAKRRYCIIFDPSQNPRRRISAFDPALFAGRGREPHAELWTRYFAATENPSRTNPRLQRQLVPMRYRTHLTEFGALS